MNDTVQSIKAIFKRYNLENEIYVGTIIRIIENILVKYNTLKACNNELTHKIHAVTKQADEIYHKYLYGVKKYSCVKCEHFVETDNKNDDIDCVGRCLFLERNVKGNFDYCSWRIIKKSEKPTIFRLR